MGCKLCSGGIYGSYRRDARINFGEGIYGFYGRKACMNFREDLFDWKLKVLVQFFRVKRDWRANSPPTHPIFSKCTQ